MDKKPRLNCEDELKRYVKGIELMKGLVIQQKRYNEERKMFEKKEENEINKKQKKELGEKESDIRSQYTTCKTGIGLWGDAVLFIGPLEEIKTKRIIKEIEEYFSTTRYECKIGEITFGDDWYILLSTSNYPKYKERGAIITKSGIQILHPFEQTKILTLCDKVFNRENIKITNEEEKVKSKNPIDYFYKSLSEVN